MTDLSTKSTAELLAAKMAAERALAIDAARTSLLAYARLMMPDMNAPDDATRSEFAVEPHHRLLAEALERVAAGKCRRLAISMPPQHGKSQLASRYFPAWWSGRNPKKHLMFGTYSDTFAGEFGGEMRDIVQSSVHKSVFPDYDLKTGSQNRELMMTTKGGKLAFVGRGGRGTGKPADLIVIDDPLKNEEEAESATIRRILHGWFSKVIYARSKVTTPIIIIQTRWTEDDLIGRLCDPEHPEHDPEIAKEWTYINIPAVLKPGPLAEAMGIALERQSDPLVLGQFGTEPMAALWAERFPLRHLATASKLNPHGFNALYMGKPTPDDGDYFRADWLVEYDEHELPKNLRRYGASDHATSEDEKNDPNVIGCVGIDESDIIWVLPDLIMERMQTDEVVETMLDQMRRNRPMMWWAEGENIFKAFGPFLYKRMHEERVYCVVDPITPSRKKSVRARSIQGRMSMKKVRFPKFAPWWQTARMQMLKFPYATHDDFVDFMALIGLGLVKELPASRELVEEDNVVRVGTMDWIKGSSAARKRAEERKKAIGGW